MTQRNQFIFWWLLINEDTINQFCPDNFSETVHELFVSFLAQHKTGINYFYISNSVDMHDDYEAAILNSHSVKTLIFDNCCSKKSDHLLQLISKTCQLNNIAFYGPFETGTGETYNQFLNEQGDTLQRISMIVLPKELLDDFASKTWVVQSSVNEQAIITFKSLEHIIICMEIFQLFKNHGYSFPTVTTVHLRIVNQPDEEPFYKLDEDLSQIFPKLQHFELETANIWSSQMEQLGKLAEMIDELFLQNVKFKVSVGIIQNFTKADTIYLDFAKHQLHMLPKIPLMNPELVLLNLVKLYINAPQACITFPDYLAFFKLCPKLIVFHTLLHTISEYDKSYFIQKISEQRIGQNIEEFGLCLPDNVLSKDLLQAMIKYWPCLQVINVMHKITEDNPFDAANINDLANSLHMEAFIDNVDLRQLSVEIYFRLYYQPL